MSRRGLIAGTAAILVGLGWLVFQNAGGGTPPEARRAERFAAVPLPGREDTAGSVQRRERGARNGDPGEISRRVDERLRYAREGVAPEVKARRPGDGVADTAGPDGTLFAPFDVVDRGERPIEATNVDFQPGAGVVLEDDSSLIFPAEGNVDGSAGTINFVIEPEWEGGDDSKRTLVRIDRPGDYKSRIQVIKSGEFLRFMFVDADGADRNLTFSIAEWHRSERHQVTATWGDGDLVLYVDGAEAAKLDFSGAIDVGPGSELALGSATIDGLAGAAARITDFTVLDHPQAPGAP